MSDRPYDSGREDSLQEPKIHERLLDMADACAVAAEIVDSCTWEQFHQNGIAQSAASNVCIRLGEHAKELPEDFTARHPEVDWKSALRRRDRLAHHYAKRDLRIIWNTLVDVVPHLAETIAPILYE